MPLHPVDVLLILTRGEQVLLGLREGTGYADGWWNLPSGKLEMGEDAVSAVAREAREEIGIRLTAPRAVATVHHRSPDQSGRVGLVFAAELDAAEHGAPVNAEPHKCARIAWFGLRELPGRTYPYSVACVRAYLGGERFALSGW
jgi:8-oxo-dGTP pyrophosphatase MutT (NUDIX family)